MKKYIKAFLIFLSIILLTSCNNANLKNENNDITPKYQDLSQELKDNIIGFYSYSYTPNNTVLNPYIILYSNGRFEFNLGAVSSYIPNGKYELKDDILTLYNDNLEKYIFKTEKENLIFDSKNSSNINIFHFLPNKDSIKPNQNKKDDEMDLQYINRPLESGDIFKKMSIDLPDYKDIMQINITTQVTPKVEKISIDKEEDIRYVINLLKEIGYKKLDKTEDIKGWKYYIQISYQTADNEKDEISLSFIDDEIANFNGNYYETLAYDGLKLLNLFTKYEKK